jgi:hypothetical protein
MNQRHEGIEARRHEVVIKGARDQVPAPALSRFAAPSLPVRTRALKAWSPLRACVPSRLRIFLYIHPAQCPKMSENVRFSKIHFHRTRPRRAPRRTIPRENCKTKPNAILSHPPQSATTCPNPPPPRAPAQNEPTCHFGSQNPSRFWLLASRLPTAYCLLPTAYRLPPTPKSPLATPIIQSDH